jgi:RecG-like helicase
MLRLVCGDVGFGKTITFLLITLRISIQRILCSLAVPFMPIMA